MSQREEEDSQAFWIAFPTPERPTCLTSLGSFPQQEMRESSEGTFEDLFRTGMHAGRKGSTERPASPQQFAEQDTTDATGEGSKEEENEMYPIGRVEPELDRRRL